MRPGPVLRWPPQHDAVPPAAIGHNGGPPLNPPVNDAYVRFMWKRAHSEVWRTPPRDIALFRLKRAQAAGVDYRTYMLTLLDTGRHMQAGDAGTPANSPQTEASTDSSGQRASEETGHRDERGGEKT